MTGENLTVQQRAFIDQYLKSGFFTGKHNRKVLQSYESYLLVEDTYKQLMLALPGSEARVQQLGLKAQPAMALKNKGEFDQATVVLAPLIGEARQLGETLRQEHQTAVQRLRRALLALPADDAQRALWLNQAAGVLDPALAEIATATATLGTLAGLAETRATVTLPNDHRTAVEGYTRALAGLPPTDTRTTAITTQAVGPLSVTLARDMGAAIVTLGTLRTSLEQLKLTIAGERTALLEDLRKLADPGGASNHEKAAMKTHREAATQAMAADYPAPADFARARKEMETLRTLIRESAQIGRLPTATAAKAREALEGFDRVLGDMAVTPEMAAESQKRRDEADRLYKQARAGLKQAEQMPAGTPQEIEARNRAIRTARQTVQTTERDFNAARTLSKAIVGKVRLTEALTVGALSPDAGRPLPENAAQKIIAAFTTEPEVAQEALDLAQRSRDPDKLADALPKICEHVSNNFLANGRSYTNDSYARDYGVALLKQGDYLGGDYFDGLETYLASGKQFEASVLGTSNNDTLGNTNNRTRALASALIDGDGTLKLDGADAKKVLDQLRFSPDATLKPTPALTEHVLHTFEQLATGNNGTQAAEVFKAIKAPTGKPSSDLVGVAVGKGKDRQVTDKDTKVAVMKAFLTPMDQGPVGSCFTTAPTRRFREEQPIKALKGITEVATTGKFTSATGVKVPAAANPPDGEDPLLRSWEYSIASAAGTEAGSRQRKRLRNNMMANPAIGTIADLIGGTNPIARINTENAIQMEIQDAFNFSYNPTKEVTDANDGSSSTGRYQIVETDEFGAPTGDPIDTPEKFVEVMSRRLLAKLKLDPTSEKGQQVKAEIENSMLETRTPPPPGQPYKVLAGTSFKPWELPSGGLGLGPTRALYGDTVETTEMLQLPGPQQAKEDAREEHARARAMPQDTPEEILARNQALQLAVQHWNEARLVPMPTVEERSKDVLLTVLEKATAHPTEKYLTIDSRGCHEYNALPSSESLQALVGDSPEKTRENVEKLIRTGHEMADRKLPLDRALYLYRKQTQTWVDREKDPTTKQKMQKAVDDNRPTAELKPAELRTRILAANKVAMDLIATQRGGNAKTIEKRKKRYNGIAETELLNMMATELATPQVVYADSNWGSGGSHTYFVMMPDPATGELQMFKRKDPPGDLTPMPREKWIDKRMHITQ